MGRPIRNVQFNPTGNVLSGTAPHGHKLAVYRENTSTKQVKSVRVGTVTADPKLGTFSVGLTGMPLGTHVLRVVQDGNDRFSDPLTVTVTTAS